MMMNDKIDSFFSSFILRIDNIPRDSKIYLYADYFELVSLFNRGVYITVGDMLDRFNDEGLIRQTRNSEDQAEQNDEDEIFIKEVFMLLYQRSISFENDYPYIFSEDRIILKEDLTIKQKIYVFLLLSSNLNLFSDFESDLTTEFEKICLFALKNYLPAYAIVKAFGKNSEFTGYTKDKVRQLAKLMHLNTKEEYLNSTSAKGTQDLGLDVVGWLPFADEIGNYISIFGQCACGKNWHNKLCETPRYNNFLNVYHSKINHTIFIPYSLINYNNSMFYEHHMFSSDLLIFERKRIISLIDDENIFNQLNSKFLVEKCLTYTEDIV